MHYSLLFVSFLLLCAAPLRAQGDNWRWAYQAPDSLKLEWRFYQAPRVVFENKRTKLVGYLDSTGRELLPAVYQDLPSAVYASWHATARKDGKWGVIDHNLQWITPPQYEAIQAVWLSGADISIEGFRIAVRLKGKWGVVDGKGKYTIEPIYDDMKAEDLSRPFPARKGEKWGLIDASGKVIMPFIYNRPPYYVDKKLRFVPDPNAAAPKNEPNDWFEETARYALADEKGKAMSEYAYNFYHAVKPENGLICVQKNGEKYGYLNTKGKEVIPAQYTFAFDFDKGLACVKVDDETTGYIVINTKGKLAFDLAFQEIVWFYKKRSYAKSGEKWGVVSNKGKWILPPTFDEEPWISTDGMRYTRLGDKWGFIDDETYAWRIQPQFEELEAFEYGVAAAKLNGKWGFINCAGEWLIKPTFDKVSDMSDNTAIVEIDGKMGIIRYTGAAQKPCDAKK